MEERSSLRDASTLPTTVTYATTHASNKARYRRWVSKSSWRRGAATPYSSANPMPRAVGETQVSQRFRNVEPVREFWSDVSLPRRPRKPFGVQGLSSFPPQIRRSRASPLCPQTHNSSTNDSFHRLILLEVVAECPRECTAAQPIFCYATSTTVATL